MEQIILIGALILVGGIIGWTTNKIAIKMLFRPIKPIKVLFFTFHGVLPKRKDQISVSIAETIQTEFLSEDEIMSKVINAIDLDEVKVLLKEKLIVKFREALPPMVLMMFNGKLEELVIGFIDKEGDSLLNELLETFGGQGFGNLNITEIIRERIDKLDFIEFEKLIYNLTKKELKHIEFIGLILGLLIGLVQSLLVLFI
ncbi:DUF445 family protein [Mycoplasmatota bacterium WC44]